MTDGATRRIELMNRLKQENRPLSGAELAKEFGVSRQVIVQDIALLRATNRNILSTNKGYVLYDPEHGQNLCRRILQSAACGQSTDVRQCWATCCIRLLRWQRKR